MDQLWVGEVHLAHTVHYNGLEIWSEAFFFFFSAFKYSVKCLIDMFLHEGGNKPLSVCQSTSKYRMMLNIETLQPEIIDDVREN